MPHELRHQSILFSDDPTLLDFNVVHAFLSTSYWSPNIPRALVEKAAANSLCFGVYDTGAREQVGYARIISDKATYAYLADVFILESHRGRGLSKLLMQHTLNHPDLQGLRRIALMTKDAQGLYAQFGFKHLDDPTRYMEVRTPNPYAAPIKTP